MERKVFIDKFFVPARAVDEFVQRMTYNRKLLRTFHGFVSDQGYQQSDENGNQVFVTVAIWESLDAINKAKEAVQEEYKRIGFNVPDFIQKHDIKMERGIYQEIDN